MSEEEERTGEGDGGRKEVVRTWTLSDLEAFGRVFNYFTSFLCWVLVVAHRIFCYSTQILWLWCLGSVVTVGRLSCFKACGILVP